jgi:hypothetical protein
MSSEQDRNWLLSRLDSVNENQVQFFIEKVDLLWGGGNGMPPQQARAAALILLCDKMNR